MAAVVRPVRAVAAMFAVAGLPGRRVITHGMAHVRIAVALLWLVSRRAITHGVLRVRVARAHGLMIMIHYALSWSTNSVRVCLKPVDGAY